MSNRLTDHRMTGKVRELVARGYSNKEISNLLSIHRGTVDYHVIKLYRQAGIWGSGNQRRFMVWLLTGNHFGRSDDEKIASSSSRSGKR